MSIVIVAFTGAPTVSEEAIKKEQELDNRIEAKIKEILADVDVRDVDLPYVMHTISEDIDGLPPGGGLSSKKNTVESILNRLRPKKTVEEEDNTATVEDDWR